MADYLAQLNIGARIGGGHYGDVHEATCPLQGKVAVKLLRQIAGESAAAWAARSTALLAEGRRLKSAQHQNIVGVHQVVRDANNVVHLVTEYCDGGSLQAAYEADPMPLHKVRKIITHACAGLACIHNVGMIHRDIKPANILCNGTGYKVGDFGLVTNRMLHGYASAEGYVSHLAPEVFGTTGTPGITSAKTDIWALGMTVFRLLHGHGFYQDNFGLLNAAHFEQRITAGGFGQSLPWLPHIPDKWKRFVRKAMQDDSSQRFQSAHEMSQALASLPIEPRWNCHYVFDRVTWTRTEQGRTTTVEWRIHTPRKHTWSAVRTGAGKRAINVGGTGATKISGSLAKEQLEKFFKDEN